MMIGAVPHILLICVACCLRSTLTKDPRYCFIETMKKEERSNHHQSFGIFLVVNCDDLSISSDRMDREICGKAQV